MGYTENVHHRRSRLRRYPLTHSLWMNTMNRCENFPMIRAMAAMTLALSLMPCAAQLGERQFPPSAVRGSLVITLPPDVLLDGRPDRLSPGSRIRSQNNMLVLSATLVGQTHTANFTRDAAGLIHEVWLLSATEAEQPLPKGTPTRNFNVGSGTEPTGRY